MHAGGPHGLQEQVPTIAVQQLIYVPPGILIHGNDKRLRNEPSATVRLKGQSAGSGSAAWLKRQRCPYHPIAARLLGLIEQHVDLIEQRFRPDRIFSFPW